ncbi:MAG: flagellar basal body-associated FliL family protein [Actinomycetota bacterium]|nr:flagellar basal body-associated FliL family protein [Actinomycetota bacterium]
MAIEDEGLGGKVQEIEDPKKKKGENLKNIKVPLIAVVVIIFAIVAGLIVSKVLKKDSSKTEKKKELPAIYMLDLETFTVNLAGSSGYLQVGVQIEIDDKDEELKVELESRRVQIKDAVISVLRSKTAEEVNLPGGGEAVKEEIKNRVDSMLTYGTIKGVYFTTFITQ